VLADRDPLTGAVRDSVFVSAADADRRGISNGDAVLVRSAHGEMPGRAFVTEIAPGNVQVLFPEGNVLLPTGPREPLSHVPDYNTTVELIKR
jgi:anaerobic selenocysteine-containing dehydrogenase